MVYQSYSLTRFLGDDAEHGTTFTIADDDAINCAHMLAAAFNTISRNMLGDFALAVVDTKAGTVQYDGKIEQIKRDEPWSVSQSFNFEGSTAGDTLLTFLGEDAATTYTLRGSMKADEPSKYTHVAREVLEDAYGELEDVKNVLFDAGVETIPADAGVRDLLAVKRSMSAEIERRDVEIAGLVQQRANQNAAARDELIEFARGAYEKLSKVDPEGSREDLQNRYRGMLDVLANLLVAIGEADRDERHAVARRLVENLED
jgi:hypothetical protein